MWHAHLKYSVKNFTCLKPMFAQEKVLIKMTCILKLTTIYAFVLSLDIQRDYLLIVYLKIKKYLIQFEILWKKKKTIIKQDSRSSLTQ